MKKTRPARSLAFASFLVLSVSVVRGQRCMPDVEWEDMGRDGCINFKQGNDKISWTLAGLECIKIEYAGRYAQLMRFRDSSQVAADTSFNALYAKFKQYENALGGYVWVNIYQGSDTGYFDPRSPTIHRYLNWQKTLPYYNPDYTTYNYLPQNGWHIDDQYWYRWKNGEPSSDDERCYEVMIGSTNANAGLNDENCGDRHYFACQMPALCTSAERQVEFGCECDDAKSYDWNGACTPCPHGRASWTGVNSRCTCNAGFYWSETSTGEQKCFECTPGTYAAGGSTVCEQCSAGSYTEQYGASRCDLCAAGKYTGSRGSTSCTPCEAGQAAPSVGTSICSTCGVGAYATANRQACVLCEVGKYQPAINQESCQSCAAGKYQSERGQVVA